MNHAACTNPQPDRAPRRGVSLIELLIVIALLLSLGALVLPALSERLAERSFASAGEQVVQHLLLVRATAMQEGRSLEVRFLPGSPQWNGRGRLVVQPFNAAMQVLDERELRDAVRRDDRVASRLDLTGGTGAGSGAAEYSSQVAQPAVETLFLPGDIAVQPSLSAEDIEHAGDDWVVLDDAQAEAGTAEQSDVRVVVYLPDGSALVSDAVDLRDRDGRRATIEVNPFTGVPSLLPAAVVREEPADDASDEDRPAPPDHDRNHEREGARDGAS
ncbi:MAG: pilus assembly FimT family protein [Phycisphaerales bacterium]